jgi:Caspase domain
VARRALLVAADRYEDPGYQELRAPAGDVHALQAALADPHCGAFEVRPPLMNRDEPTLRAELEDFFESASYDDELLLYISSHGELRAGRLYFATTTTSRARLRSTALADSFVHELMEHSPARFVILVLDCCHSGAFGKGIPKAPPEIELEERFEGSGRVTLAASAQIEYAFEGEAAAATDQKLPGSVFTSALVDGLRGADANDDGVVTLDELYAFVRREVRRRNPQQTPRLLGDRAGDIVIARLPGAPRSQLPEELARHIDSPLWYVRKGAAEELARLSTGRDRAIARAAEAALRSLADDPDRRVADTAKELASNGAPAKTPPTDDPIGPSTPTPASEPQQVLHRQGYPVTSSSSGQPGENWRVDVLERTRNIRVLRIRLDQSTHVFKAHMAVLGVEHLELDDATVSRETRFSDKPRRWEFTIMDGPSPRPAVCCLSFGGTFNTIKKFSLTVSDVLLYNEP